VRSPTSTLITCLRWTKVFGAQRDPQVTHYHAVIDRIASLAA
jgi:hypothetical protein